MSREFTKFTTAKVIYYMVATYLCTTVMDLLVPILEISQVVHISDEWFGADGMKGNE